MDVNFIIFWIFYILSKQKQNVNEYNCYSIYEDSKWRTMVKNNVIPRYKCIFRIQTVGWNNRTQPLTTIKNKHKPAASPVAIFIWKIEKPPYFSATYAAWIRMKSNAADPVQRWYGNTFFDICASLILVSLSWVSRIVENTACLVQCRVENRN